MAIAGVSALLVLALLAAVITTHDSAPLIQKGDIKGAVSGAVNRVKAGGLSEVADSVGQHSSRILSSVSEKSTELSGHLEGLSKATGEGLGGLSKAAGDGLGGLSKATGEHIENLTKAAGETAAKAGRGRR